MPLSRTLCNPCLCEVYQKNLDFQSIYISGTERQFLDRSAQIGYSIGEKGESALQYEHYRDNKEYFNVGKNVSFAHFHRAIELVFCLKTPKAVTLDGVDMTVGEHELLVVPPFCTHAFPRMDGHVSVCCVLPVSFTDLFESSSGGKALLPQTIAGEGAERIADMLQKLRHETQPLIRTGICTCIVGLLEKYAAVEENPRNESGFHLRVLTYIEKHYAEDITAESTADMLGYNKYYFSTLFNRGLSVHFCDYLNMVRINKSLPLLATHTVGEAARMVGYHSEQSYFSNFKKVTGMTPRAYLLHTRGKS